MKKLIFLLPVAIIAFSFTTSDKPMGLNIGDVAPDFTAKNQSNKDISLKTLLQSGSVVLLFYRGEWCPYCNRQLKALEDSLTFIKAKGANIIAVSPEKTENIYKTVEKTKATYHIVTDEQSLIMKAYKVAYELDEKTTEKYKGYGINLVERNGTNGNNLPVPAVYIINKEGKVTYRYFDSNYKNRASVKEILKNL
ncbi:MAG: peroxiredoxin family protein [Sediminibacterium sp.]|nr:peroxiredoxin family protein [Sediminibacterium sp.]